MDKPNFIKNFIISGKNPIEPRKIIKIIPLIAKHN